MKIGLYVGGLQCVIMATDITYSRSLETMDIYTPCFHYYGKVDWYEAERIMNEARNTNHVVINILNVSFERIPFHT